MLFFFVLVLIFHGLVLIFFVLVLIFHGLVLFFFVLVLILHILVLILDFLDKNKYNITSNIKESAYFNVWAVAIKSSAQFDKSCGTTRHPSLYSGAISNKSFLLIFPFGLVNINGA